MRPSKAMVLVLVLVLVFGSALVETLRAATTCAEEPPPLPHAFYGTVELHGTPAPVGTVIEARGESVVTGVPGNPLVLTIPGRYGARTLSEPRLVVQGNLQDDTPLEFYINGVRAQVAVPDGPWQDTYPFTAGLLTELNLRATQYTLYLPITRR